MNAIPPSTHKGSCWCPRCHEEGVFWVESLTTTFRLVCEGCGRSTSHAHCDACGVSGPIEFPIPEPGMPWACRECGTRHRVPADFLEQAVVFSLCHQGADAPPPIKTGKQAWRGVIRMMLMLGALIWVYYQFFYDWPA